MKKSNIPLYETLAMLFGELLVSAIVCVVFLIIGKFNYTVITGVALGSAITILNFLFLFITTNRAIDAALAARGDKELTEEEALAFAQKYQGKIQATVKMSFIVRTLSIAATLVLAFLLGNVFHVIATLVPLLMLRPILTVAQLIKRKGGN